jgi:multidrug resistance efflux pump
MAAPAPQRSKLLPSIILIVLLIGVGGGIAGLLYAFREETPRREVGNPAPVVEWIALQMETVTEGFRGYGSAEPVREANLAAEVAGRVIELVDDIRAGSIIKEGRALVRLDAREYRHTLDRANALADAAQAGIDELLTEAEKLNELIETAEDEVRVAHNEYLRVADLFERDHAAKKEYDFANLAYQQARRVLQGYQKEAAKTGPRKAGLIASRQARLADAELAKLQIERCEIRAPFGGRIRALNVELGERVGPGSVLMSLIDPSHVEIAIRLPAAVYSRTRVGAACRLESESMPGVMWSGQVARIAPAADETTRTFAAYVEVDNTVQSQPLVPGTFVWAEVQGPVYEDRILIPRGAIRDGYALVAEQGLARRRSVTVERRIGDRAIVFGEVARGDRLILTHLDQLSDGSPVRLHTTVVRRSDGPEEGEAAPGGGERDGSP